MIFKTMDLKHKYIFVEGVFWEERDTFEIRDVPEGAVMYYINMDSWYVMTDYQSMKAFKPTPDLLMQVMLLKG